MKDIMGKSIAFYIEPLPTALTTFWFSVKTTPNRLASRE